MPGKYDVVSEQRLIVNPLQLEKDGTDRIPTMSDDHTFFFWTDPSIDQDSIGFGDVIPGQVAKALDGMNVYDELLSLGKIGAEHLPKLVIFAGLVLGHLSHYGNFAFRCICLSFANHRIVNHLSTPC
jgi:hypothetical protein